MADPYASHIPVLKAIGNAATITSVLEFGCGRYSTLTFLDRSIYPFLTALVSYETDVQWKATMEGIVGGDPRVVISVVNRSNGTPPTPADMAYFSELGDYDLILIDDGPSDNDRVLTIKAVCERSPDSIVVIHDWDVLLYREVSRGAFDHIKVYDDISPYTAMLWNGDDRQFLEELW